MKVVQSPIRLHLPLRTIRWMILPVILLLFSAVNVYAQTDTDMDGINDDIELLEGTDPNDPADTPVDRLFNVSSVTASSRFANSPEVNLRIEAGLSATPTGSLSRYREFVSQTSHSTQWLSDAVAFPHTVTFDMGTSGADFDAIYIWQYNRALADWSEWGTNAFDIEYATVDNPSTWISLGSHTLAKGADFATLTTETKSVGTVEKARYVRLTINSNHSAGGAFAGSTRVGLGKVRFQGIDTDGDGINNASDPDDDNDGVADVSDAFRLNASASVDTDGDGMPDDCVSGICTGGLVLDNDDDNDGVADASDNCSLVANADQSDIDFDGLGDVCDNIIDARAQISAPSAAGTLGEDVSYTISYTNAASISLTSGDVILNTTGDATATPVVSGTGLTTRTVTLTSIGGTYGTIGISLPAGTGNNVAGDGPAIAVGPSSTFQLTDSDMDNVWDPIDNCPSTPNTNQLNSDGAADGGDACDADDDNDGQPDTYEIAAGTDPLDASSMLYERSVTPVSGTASSTAFGGVNNTLGEGSLQAPEAGTGNLTRFRKQSPTAGATDMWVSGTGAFPHTLTYDLGATGEDIDGVYLWQYNQSDFNGYQAGIKDFTLEYATVDNPTNFLNVGNYNMQVADGVKADSAQYKTFSTLQNVRFVKLIITDNFYGGTSNLTGLAKIRFQYADADADQIRDRLDNCPATASSNLADTDGDGIGDVCDNIVNASVALSSPSTTSFTGTDVTYTLTYTNAATITLSASDVMVNASGDAGATAVVSGTGLTTRTVTLTSIDGSNGTIGISIAAGTANNAAADGPTLAVGPSETFGFADTDNDGVVDYLDSCPNGITGIPDVSDPDLDGDGCKNSEDDDDDGDGVLDGSDNCPLTANADQLNTDGAADGGDVCDDDDDNDGFNDTVELAEGTDPLDANSKPIDKLFNAVSATASNSGFGTSADLTISETDLTPLVAGSLSRLRELEPGGLSNYWVTDGTVLPHTLTYDLGVAGADLDGVYIWQYNRVNGINTTIGAQEFTMEYATVNDPANFVSLGSYTLAKAPGGTNISAEVKTFAAIEQVRYMRLTITSSHGATFVGLGKVRFQGIDTDGDGILNLTDTDDDGDGVPDATDNCRLTVNADQADADGDGIGDVCDPSVNATASIGNPVYDGSTITYEITYTNAATVTLVDSDVTVNASGDGTATVAVSGTGTTTRAVTLSNISGTTGNIGISLAAGTGDNAAGNGPVAAIGPSQTMDFQQITFGALANKTFGDAPFDLSATGGASGNTVTYISSNTSVATISGNTVTIVGGGTTNITASQAGSGTYLDAAVTQSLTVNQAAQVITFGGLSSRTLGDAAFNLSATGGASGNPVTFSGNNPAVATVSAAGEVVIVGAGTVSITASQVGNANYADAVGVTQSLIVNQGSQMITFGGLPSRSFGDAAFNLSATGGDSGNPVTFSGNNPDVATVSAAGEVVIVGVGTVFITANQSGNANYTDAPSVLQPLTIFPFSTTINLDLPTVNPKYTGQEQGITATANDSQGNPTLATIIEYSPTGAGTFTTTVPVDAGTYDVRARLSTAEKNYSASQVTGSYTIDKAPLTARLNDVSIVYGTPGKTEHPTTYTGFVNGETESVLVLAQSWPVAFTSENGAFYEVGGPYTGKVTWAPNPAGSVSSPNYSITFLPGDITSVTARPINITADNRSIAYGDDANIGNTITFEADGAGESGLASGENASDFTGTVTFDHITSVNVGSYSGAIIPNGGLTNSNYVINYVPGDLTITEKALTVTANNRTVTYGDDANTGNTVNYAGFITGETESVLGGTLAFGTISETNVGAHPGVIVPSGLTSSNYAISYVNGDLTISPRTITVTADAQSKTFGDTDPALTYQITNGALQFSDALSGTPTREAGEDVGSYAITQGTLANSNYTITFVSDHLTIAKANQSLTFPAIATRQLGDADFSLGVTPGASISPVTYVSSDVNIATVNASGTVTIRGVGSVSITASQLGDTNHNDATDVSQTLTVNHASYSQYFVKVHSIYGIAAGGQTALVKTLSTTEGQNIEALVKVGNQIWGTATQGGANGNGTLFRLDPDGTNFQKLHDFTVGEGKPRNDMAVVADTAVYGVVGNYGIFRASVTNPSGGLTHYTGYSGNNQFKNGLVYNRGQLWIRDGADIIAVNIDFSGHEVEAVSGIRNYTAATDFVIEGYQMAMGGTTTQAFWLESMASFEPFEERTWQNMNGNLPAFYPVPDAYATQTKMLFSDGEYYIISENVGSHNITAMSQPPSRVNGILSMSSRYRGFYTQFLSPINGTAWSSLSESYVNLYDAKDTVVYGIRGDAATGLYEAFAVDLNTEQYQIVDFGGGNLAAGVPNAGFFNFRKTATIVSHDQTKAFGDPIPSLTYDIWGLDVGDDATTIGGVTISPEVIYGIGINLPDNVVSSTSHPGTYPIMVTADTTNGKYDLRHQFGVLTITYGIQQSDIDFAPATASMEYDGTAKSFTASGKAGTPAGSSALHGADISGSSLTATHFDYVYSMSTNGGVSYDVVLSEAPSAAGLYRVTATVKSANTVYSGSATYDFEITPRAITVTADAKSKTYGDADPTFTYQVTSGTLVGSDVLSGTLAREAGEDVGAYAITQGTLDAGSNYTITYVSDNLIIGTRGIEVTAHAQSKIYGDADPTFSYQVTSGALQGSDAFSGTLSRAAGENIGNYAITQGTLDAGNNYVVSFVSDDLTITARNLIVAAEAKSKIYGDTDPAFTYQIISGALQGSDAFSGSLTRVAGEGIGGYEITQGTLDPGSNYTMTFITGSLTIGTRAITLTADAQAKTYGDADPTLSYSVTSGALQFTDAISGALDRTAGEDVGTYAIGQGTLSAGNNYAVTFIGDDLTINTRPIEVTADAVSKVYGDSDPSLTYQLTAGVLQGSDMLSGDLERVAGEDAGAYAINQGTLTAGSNYTITYNGNDFAINPIGLSITADDKTKLQGTANPTFTYRITSGALINGDQLTGSLTVPPSAIGVGMYPIQQGTLTAGGNYAIAFTDGTLTITDKLLQTITFDALTPATYGDALTVIATGGGSGNAVTFTGDNPAVATVATTGEVTIVGVGTVNITANQAGDATYAAAAPVIQTLTVNQAALTITADNKTSTYGDATLPSLSLTYSGFVNSETATVLTTAPGLSTTATTISNAGTYPITVSGAAATNYAITHVDGTLTVNKATLTATASNGSKTYGSANPSFTVSYAGFVNGESATVIDTAPTATTTATTTSSVGTYTVTAAGGVDTNYDFTYANGTLTVTKATLMATASSGSRAYGSANPSFTVSYTGFVNGESATVIDTAPTATTAATTTSTVGTYTVTAAGGVDTNYDFTYANGTLTVSQAALTATVADATRAYGIDNPAFTIGYTGFVNGEDASVIDIAPTTSTEATSTSAPGTYAIAIAGGTDNNYAITQVDGTLTVNKATLTATASSGSRTYGSANPAFTVSYTGFVNGEDASVIDTAPTATTVATSTSSVGTYTVTSAGGVDNNYAFTYTNGTLTVSKATLTATVADASRAFGTANPAFTIGYTGFVNGEDATVIDSAPTTSTEATSTSAPGTYAIAIAGGTDNNYAITQVAGTLTVTKADQAIEFNTLPGKLTTDAAFDLTATASSGLAVTYSSSNEAVATISGSTVTILGAGTTTITANQAGDDNYNAATVVTQDLVVTEGNTTTTYSVSGTITDAAGNAFSNGIVVIRDNNDVTISQSANINTDGTYSFTALTTGDYELFVTPFDAANVLTFYGNVSPILDPSAAGTILKVTSDQTGINITLQAAPQSAVEFLSEDQGGMIEFFAQNNQGNGNRIVLGRVENGEPLPNTLVILKTADGDYVAADVTDETGLIMFTGLPTGDYRLELDVPGVGIVSADVAVVEGEMLEVTALIDENGASFDVNEVLNTLPDHISRIEVYPNPTVAYFELKSFYQVEQIDVFDLEGRKVETFQHQQRYNIKELKEGIYLLKIVTKKGSEMKRMMKR